MKKILFILISIILFIPSVYANKINKIDMDIYINKDGSAQITEVWDVYGTDGTEWYKAINDLTTNELINFKVSMDGKPLKLKEWNVDESLAEKKGYYGINTTSKGIELCFGKYDLRKNHKFTLEYTIIPFVYNVDDTQIVYWNLIDKLTNVDFKNFYIKISSYYSFPDDLDVWGFGHKGFAYVKDGIIELSNIEEKTMKDQYVVVLIKFPAPTFTSTNTTNRFSTFNDVYNAAYEGTFEYDYSQKTNAFSELISKIFPVLMFVFVIVIVLINKSSSGYGYKNNKKINKKEVMPFREIPCDKNIFYADTLIKLNKFDYKQTNILGAIILKWIKLDKITIKTETKGIFNKETSVLDLTKSPTFDNKLESKLFSIMFKASKDGFLEPKELERYCKNNYSSFFDIFDKHIEEQISELTSKGLIRKRIDKTECRQKNVMEDKLYYDSINLYGLKKFLIEFASMNEKTAIEVKLWDEYLMFAYLFGIADKVASQLKKLYPEVFEQVNYDYNTVVFLNHISRSSYSAASAARSAAENYSSGGGGFSIGGGGGGSFGGGGGGSR